MAFLFYLLAFASLICLLVFLKKPSFTPLKQASKNKNIGLYLGLCLLFFILAGSVGGPDEAEQPAMPGEAAISQKTGERPVGGVLKWEEASRREVPMQNGRNRLVLLITPAEDQSGATRRDLLSTATGAAIKYQKESGAPVVILSLASRKTESGAGEPLLAHVVYIPDGKGFDGDREDSPQWETLRAAARGFNEAELEYLKLWTEMYKEYQGRSGLRAEELDAAVCHRLGLAPGALSPFANTLEDVED